MRVEGDNLIIGVELQSDLGEKHDYQQRAFTPMMIQRMKIQRSNTPLFWIKMIHNYETHINKNIL